MTEPKKATAMSMLVCGEDHLHIELLDDEGEVFATAQVDVEAIGDQVLEIAAIYLDIIGELDEDDAIGPVMGSC